MATKKALITRGMNEGQNTSNRPEQIRARNIIIKHMPRLINYSIKTEYLVEDLKPEPEVHLSGNRAPRLDIVILIKYNSGDYYKKIGIRMHGPPHDRERQGRYDDMQEGILVKNGWEIVNFWYDKMPALWETTPEDYVKTAYMEVKENLLPVFTLIDYP